jgi:hypothetical protein
MKLPSALVPPRFARPIVQLLASIVHVPTALELTLAPLIEHTEALPESIVKLTGFFDAPAGSGHGARRAAGDGAARCGGGERDRLRSRVVERHRRRV